MKRTLSLAVFAALLAVGAPLGAARAADLDPPARSSVHHGHNYTGKCQARLDRCTKWFAGKGEWCQQRYDRCEARFAMWHERRVGHYEMRHGPMGHHRMGHPDKGHHAMRHHNVNHHDMKRHAAGHSDRPAMDRHHMRGDAKHGRMMRRAADATK